MAISRKGRWAWRLAASTVAILLAGSYATYALVQPIAAIAPETTFHFTRSAQTVSLTWPSYGEAALGATGYGVLATHGAEQPLATASTIKVLTALVVLQQKPLQQGEAGPTITLTQTDVDSYAKYVSQDGSVVRVAVGEQLTEYEALEALLLPSANNIAETLARWAFGSIDTYTAYANAYARQLGMANTTVTDPSGFMGTTVSTPRDLVVLGETAVSNPVVSEIMRKASSVIPVQGTIRNVNVLLGQEGIVGIKTGNNDQDPGCFLFASEQKVGASSVTIVGVIMNGPTLGTAMWDALPLIRSAVKNFSEVTVVKAGDAVATYKAPWSNPVTAVVNESITFAAWNGTAVNASVSARTVTAPQGMSASVGNLAAHNLTGYTSDVVLSQPLPKPSIIWKLTHPLR